jgi:hypothetical protein
MVEATTTEGFRRQMVARHRLRERPRALRRRHRGLGRSGALLVAAGATAWRFFEDVEGMLLRPRVILEAGAQR